MYFALKYDLVSNDTEEYITIKKKETKNSLQLLVALVLTPLSLGCHEES